MMKFKSRPTYTDKGESVSGVDSTKTLGTTAHAVRNKEGKSSTRSRANWASTSSGVPGMPNTSVSNLPIEIDIDPLLKDIVFSEDLEQKKLIYRLYRDIYYNDAVAGSAVDLLSTLPFSDFTLGGITDNRAMSAFLETIERLNIRTLLPEISVDFLVTGNFIGSLLFNSSTKKFIDIMPHQGDNAKIEQLPFYGQDPIITVAFPDHVREVLQNTGSTRIRALRERLGDTVIKQLSEGALELDPLSTIYLPRKSFSNSEGNSYFRRILPIYLIEKNLFRGTLVESARRQRGIMHLTLGDGDQWEPSIGDMEFMTELFTNADADPLGAIIATRMGVSAEELRQGGDFWKVTDIWDSTAQFKLRALGISESFLSGDANYACLTGGSLIPTSEGLVRLDGMVNSKHLPTDTSESKKDIYVPIDHLVQSRYANECAAKWKYSGFTNTLKITTELGNDLTCTGEHPFLVFNRHGDTGWKKASRLKVGDHVCIPTKGLVRSTKLRLNLTDQEELAESRGVRKLLKQPNSMTPKLAYLLGALVAEGWITEDKKVSFSNSDEKFLNRVAKFYRKVFAVEASRTLRISSGDKYEILGKEGVANKDCYELSVGSKTLVTWLKELGFVYSRGDNDCLPSNNQEVPWTVMQADVESQYAFLAAFAEGDGTINARVAFASSSTKLLEQIQAMLFAFGIMAHRRPGFVELSYTDSRDFWQRTEQYRCSKELAMPSNRAVKPRPKFGFPIKFLKDFVESRKIGQIGKGTGFINDDGYQIVLDKCRENMYSINGTNFMYDKYDAGGYDGYLERLKLISESMYNKVMNLIHLRYMIVPIASIKDNGKEHVYDISMRNGVEPAFVANGIVVHNTADTSLTVFIDSLRSYRDMLTRKMFYNKLFPLISLVNGFTVNRRGKLIHKPGLMDSGSVADHLDILADGSKLLIPNVHWAKQLKPEGDSQYMDMLSTLTEKGVPVPLRAMAAAGGFNLDALLSDADDDAELLRKVSEYQKRIAEVKKTYGPKQEAGEEGGMGGFASARDDSMDRLLSPYLGRSDVLATNGGRHVGIAKRDYGEASEVVGQTRTGKKKYIHNQRAANVKINNNIHKALKAIAKNKSTPLSRTTVTPLK